MEPELKAVQSCCPDPSNGVINTVEMHTGGDPVRIVVSGYPEIKGSTILQKRQYVHNNLDYIRVMLMSEPRGHNGMCGVIIVDTDLPNAAMAVLFMHGGGYSTMCGHATISLGRYAVDYRVVPPVSPVTLFTLQCPCGPVKVKVQYEDNKTGFVLFESVPSFVVATDQTVKVPQLDNVVVRYNLCYGGAFYAFVDAENVGINLKETPIGHCIEVAGSITDQLRSSLTLVHPDSPDLGFLYGTIFTTHTSEENLILCIFAERQVCRSPCGSGVTAEIALLFHKKKIKLNEVKYFTNPKTGSVFTGKPIREEEYKGNVCVIVEVGGNGYYTGESKYWLEDDDKIGKGFLL